MTTEEHALLCAILAEPAEDTPRLVYADWLQENGDGPCPRCAGRGPEPGRVYSHHTHSFDEACSNCRGTGTVPYGRAERAEFIRVQCSAPYGPPLKVWRCECGCGRLACDAGDDPVPPQWIKEELGRCPLCPKGRKDFVEFRRGFVDSVTCTAADWERHGAAIRATQPVTRVVLTTTPPLNDWGPLSLWDEEFPGRQEMEFRHARWPGITFRLEATDAPPGEGPDEGRFG